jgi:uncharacterized protein YndB with AHSA1/START domain
VARISRAVPVTEPIEVIVSERSAPLSVDVSVETVIERPLEEVFAYASDPGNTPRWYVNIKSVEWRDDAPLHVGSEMEFVAQFLGRRLAYRYRVTELVPGERLVMATDRGPFPMETTYTWEPVARGTRMTLRNTGRPSGFARFGAGVMEKVMRRATSKDLARLKAILER